MKITKKLVALFLCLCLLAIPMISCGSKTSSVYSVGYSNGSKTARYYVDYEIKTVSEEEYKNNSENAVTVYFTGGRINVDETLEACMASSREESYYGGGSATASIKDLKHSMGKTYYIYHNGSPAKITYNDYALAYVDVTILSDGTLEITQIVNVEKDKERIRVKSDNYVITYFR